jgi:hypothetical protein
MKDWTGCNATRIQHVWYRAFVTRLVLAECLQYVVAEYFGRRKISSGYPRLRGAERESNSVCEQQF